MRERVELKGDTPCAMQGTSTACHDWKVLSGWMWSSEQNNNNNANYTNFPGGGTNNNNKNNGNTTVPFSEFDKTLELLLDAEEDCYQNKKSRTDACKVHFHLSEVVSLAREIHSGTYNPLGGICFILTYPVIREVFAARYRDRIVHHLVAPYVLAVTEAVHESNGDVSHGNRKNHSAHTAALSIQQRMQENPDGYILKCDVRSFFMSIDREKALQTFKMYESMFRPKGYTDEQREFYMTLIRKLILSDATKGCELRSPIELHNSVPFGKSLFTSGGKGFPIGNLYSQHLANLYLAPIDSSLRAPHFVDDYGDVVRDAKAANTERREFADLLEKQSLEAHPNKVYIQPVRHGVSFCGRVIYKDRLYISNRVVKACIGKVKSVKRADLETARDVMRSVNSYTGIMSHTRAFNIQKRIAGVVLERFSEWLYFRNKSGHLVCTVKRKYTERYISNQQIKTLDNYVKSIQRCA